MSNEKPNDFLMFPSFLKSQIILLCGMRIFVLIVFLITGLQTEAQFTNRHLPTYPNPRLDIEVNDYIYDHFEIGGGGHIFIILPGIHAKLRYAPINYELFKLIGEIRGEVVTAPIAGWSYHIKAGTSLKDNVGIHAGFGRSHYLWRVRTAITDFEVRNVFQNTFEFGVRFESFRRQWDFWASIPLYSQEVPIYTVGVSVTAGGLWDFKDQKWFPPKRK